MNELISPFFHTFSLQKSVLLLNALDIEPAVQLILSSLDHHAPVDFPFEESLLPRALFSEAIYPLLTPRDFAVRLGALPSEKYERILEGIKKHVPRIHAHVWENFNSPETLSTLHPLALEKILYDFPVDQLAKAIYISPDAAITRIEKGLSKNRVSILWECMYSHPIALDDAIKARLNLMLHFQHLVDIGVCTLSPHPFSVETHQREQDFQALQHKCTHLKETLAAYDSWVGLSLLRELSPPHASVLKEVLNMTQFNASAKVDIGTWESALRQINYAIKKVVATNNLTTQEDIESFQMIYFRMRFADDAFTQPLFEKLSIDALKCLAWVFIQLEGPDHHFANSLLRLINVRCPGVSWYPWPKPVPTRSEIYALRDEIHRIL